MAREVVQTVLSEVVQTMLSDAVQAVLVLLTLVDQLEPTLLLEVSLQELPD